MTLSIQQFVDKYNNTAVDFDKKFGAQCVDLFNFYNSEVVGAPWIGTPATAGARDLYEVDNPERAKFYKKLAADSQLQPGDVQVAGEPNGRYVENGVQKFLGHVRIYIGDGQFIEQNGKIAQKTAITNAKLTGVLGVLRPLRFIGENSPQNVPNDQQNKNKHKIEPGDTFWGIEERLSIPHGTLQQLNPGLDAKKLPIGGFITLPGEPAPAASATEEYYTVKSGDTYWGLEDAWQLPHGTLQQLNPTIPAKAIPIGARIRIK